MIRTTSMNSRERFHATTHCLPVDRPFRWEMRAYDETLKRWRGEGMPADDELCRIVEYDRFERAPINLKLVPGFDREVLEETSEYTVYIDDRDGVKKRIRRDAPQPAMPQYLEFPLKGRENWPQFKRRLSPDSPARIPYYWESMKRQYKNRDFPLGVSAGSMFGWLRDWMGLENIAVTMYDDPEIVHEMMDHLANLFVAVLERSVSDFRFDYAFMWEDMAYKTASMISPSHFREFLMPRYRRVVEVLHGSGIDTIMLDCDGNVSELIPLWLECGINMIYPMEVAAGMDVVAERQKNGKKLLIAGGIDKRVLASDKRAIENMVSPKLDLIREGGYIPGVDHAIPPDIPWQNFLHYRRLVDGT